MSKKKTTEGGWETRLWGDSEGELRKGRRGHRNGGEKGAGSAEGINESDRSRRGSFIARWVNFQSERSSFTVFPFLRGPQSLCPTRFVLFPLAAPRVPLRGRCVVTISRYYEGTWKKTYTACILPWFHPLCPRIRWKRRKIMSLISPR